MDFSYAELLHPIVHLLADLRNWQSNRFRFISYCDFLRLSIISSVCGIEMFSSKLNSFLLISSSLNSSSVELILLSIYKFLLITSLFLRNYYLKFSSICSSFNVSSADFYFVSSSNFLEYFSSFEVDEEVGKYFLIKVVSSSGTFFSFKFKLVYNGCILFDLL